MIHGDEESNGFTKQERSLSKGVVFANIIINMKSLLEKCGTHTNVSCMNADLAKEFMAIPDAENVANIDSVVGESIRKLWADEGVQCTWKVRAEFQVQDSLKFYCCDIDRIMASEYIPNNQDVLRARVRTSGIVEEHFKIGDVPFVIFDVGGQRNERKKWIHCFDAVTALIFVAAINEYNQLLYEDEKMNRMDEAVILFDEICNSRWFKNTSMIVFLNKRDLFREKLPEFPFRVDEGLDARFSDFEGPHCVPGTPSAVIGTPEYEECYEAAAEYCLSLFVNRNKQPKPIYHHITTATDTNNVKVVFASCRDIVLRGNLVGSGFLSAT